MGNWFTALFRRKKAEKEKSADLIVWNKSYEIGHELIDQQHRTLVNIVNDLNRIVTEQGSRDEIGKILSKLVNYTVFHFGAEEELFKNSDYPHTKEHLQKHEELVAKVSAFQEEFEDQRADVSSELLAFLTDWLVRHINGMDRGYRQYIC